VRRHIVRAFRGVAIQPRVFRNQSGHEIGQIANHIRIGILLNDQRCGRVLAKDRDQSGLRRLFADPRLNLAGELVQPFAVSSDVDLMSELPQAGYSTVTLFAKLRG